MDTQTQVTQWIDTAKTLGASIPALRYPVALWYALRDPATPLLSKVLIGGAAAYVLMPFDLIPDMLPGIGYVDDVVIAGAALRSAQKIITPAHLAQADAFLGK